MKRLSSWAALVALLCISLPGAAQSAGDDLLQTGSGSFVDLSSIGLGQVALQGVPIEACTGNADTIVRRTSSVPTGGGSVPVVMIAVFMKSIKSVTYQGQSADVYVTLNNSGGAISTNVLPQPDSLALSTGSLTVRTDGTFDSNITVNADIIFVKAGTSVTNSANWIHHQPASPQTLISANSSWSTTPPSGYPSCSIFASGGFYPTSLVHISGPHPVNPAKCPNTGTTASTTLKGHKAVSTLALACATAQ
jgi:hypothetical protein